jgi:hypothetical protein
MACDDFSINVTCGKFDFLFSNLLYKIAITLSVKLEYAVHAMWQRNLLWEEPNVRTVGQLNILFQCWD